MFFCNNLIVRCAWEEGIIWKIFPGIFNGIRSKLVDGRNHSTMQRSEQAVGYFFPGNDVSRACVTLVLARSLYPFLVFCKKNDDVGSVTVDMCTIYYCFLPRPAAPSTMLVMGGGVRACMLFSSSAGWRTRAISFLLLLPQHVIPTWQWWRANTYRQWRRLANLCCWMGNNTLRINARTSRTENEFLLDLLCWTRESKRMKDDH